MPPVVSLRQGRFAVLQADLENCGLIALGILLQDPGNDRLHIRLRRDWNRIAEEDPVLPLLADDLQSKAEEQGAEVFLQWLENHLSANLHTTDRETVAVDDFERTLNRLYARHVRPLIQERVTHVPRYSLQVAAGRLLENSEIEPAGWEEAPPDLKRITADMFAAEIVGTSMEPEIPDGSVCLFRYNTGGSRQGRMVLVEELGRGANDAYTVKRYRSIKSSDGENWRHERIILEPLNPAHQAFDLAPEEDKYRVIAEFLRVLY